MFSGRSLHRVRERCRGVAERLRRRLVVVLRLVVLRSAAVHREQLLVQRRELQVWRGPAQLGQRFHVQHAEVPARKKKTKRKKHFKKVRRMWSTVLNFG